MLFENELATKNATGLPSGPRADASARENQLPQALKLNPEFFKTVYTDLLNTKKTTKNVQSALDAIDQWYARAANNLAIAAKP